MDRYKVRRQAKKNIYVHNDLSNTAFHLQQRIEENYAADNHAGIALDILSCLVIHAFTFEAKVNFIGLKTFEDEWNERQPFYSKVNAICKTLGYAHDDKVRPFKTIKALKEFRDCIAHGKPSLIEIDETVEVEEHEIDNAIDLRAEWDNQLNIDFVRECAADIELIWKDWLKLARIELWDTLTSGEHGTMVIEKYTDTETIRF